MFCVCLCIICTLFFSNKNNNIPTLTWWWNIFRNAKKKQKITTIKTWKYPRKKVKKAFFFCCFYLISAFQTFYVWIFLNIKILSCLLYTGCELWQDSFCPKFFFVQGSAKRNCNQTNVLCYIAYTLRKKYTLKSNDMHKRLISALKGLILPPDLITQFTILT